MESSLARLFNRLSSFSGRVRSAYIKGIVPAFLQYRQSSASLISCRESLGKRDTYSHVEASFDQCERNVSLSRTRRIIRALHSLLFGRACRVHCAACLRSGGATTRVRIMHLCIVRCLSSPLPLLVLDDANAHTPLHCHSPLIHYPLCVCARSLECCTRRVCAALAL